MALKIKHILAGCSKKKQGYRPRNSARNFTLPHTCDKSHLFDPNRNVFEPYRQAHPFWPVYFYVVIKYLKISICMKAFLETAAAIGPVISQYIDEEENKQCNRKRGYAEGIGVDQSWRRRGLARALISRSLQVQKSAGMTESALAPDSDSTSGVTRLYESCGFQIVKCNTIYRKPM